MDTSEIISLSSSIAAFITSGISLFTLLEMKRQRRQSLKPDIVLLKTKWYTFYDNIKLPSIWSNQEIDTKEYNRIVNNENHISEKNNFKFTLSNIGLQAAKNILIEWNCEIEDYIKFINKYNNKREYNIEFNKTAKNIVIESKNLNEIISKNNITNLEYIMPFKNDYDSVNINLPIIIKELITCFIDIQNSIIYNKQLSEILEIPELQLNISYFDIMNNKYIKKYKIKPIVVCYKNIANDNYISTHGYFDIKEISKM